MSFTCTLIRVSRRWMLSCVRIAPWPRVPPPRSASAPSLPAAELLPVGSYRRAEPQSAPDQRLATAAASPFQRFITESYGGEPQR